MGQQEWHGMAHDDLEARGTDIPVAPSMADTFDATTYARVHFSGNYGALCGEYQEFDRTEITQGAAHQLAWSAFGLCGHEIIYYDDAGNVISKE